MPIYEKIGIPYQTPLAHVFLAPGCYLKLASRLRWYLKQPIEFISSSQHDVINKLRNDHKNNYPIALLGGDVEIQCLHYATPEEFIEKWNRRMQRLVEDDSRLFFKLCDNNGCTKEQLEEFDALPVQNKVCYTSTPMPHLKSAIHIPSKDGCVSFADQTDLRHFDAIAWVKKSDLV